MSPKTMVQEKDIIDIAPEVFPSQRGLRPDEIARYRTIIATTGDSWDSLLDSLEDARLTSLVQGKTGENQEKETQYVLRFSAEESRTVEEVRKMIGNLPADVQDRLQTLGAGLAEDLVKRYGTAAPSVLHKNCIERKPRDPVIMVDVKTGEIVFDHLDEFWETPWGVNQPRPGSLIAALDGHHKWRGKAEWENVPKSPIRPRKEGQNNVVL